MNTLLKTFTISLIAVSTLAFAGCEAGLTSDKSSAGEEGYSGFSFSDIYSNINDLKQANNDLNNGLSGDIGDLDQKVALARQQALDAQYTKITQERKDADTALQNQLDAIHALLKDVTRSGSVITFNGVDINVDSTLYSTLNAKANRFDATFPAANVTNSAGKITISSLDLQVGSTLISALDTKVAANQNSITTNQNSITTNQNSITTNLNSINLLKTKDTSHDQSITANDTRAKEAAPIGTVVPFAGPRTNIPDGWFLCNGDPKSRAGYPELFAAIGTAWGAPDGNTFNLPDLQGLFLRGVAAGSPEDPDRNSRAAIKTGGYGGDNVGSYQTDVIKSHKHQNQYSAVNNRSTPSGGTNGASQFNDRRFDTDFNEDGGSETRPVNAYVNYIIKYR
ncbi:MAG: tail fiber protein [bacterium]|nr:tail fiber protein [bacterium]